MKERLMQGIHLFHVIIVIYHTNNLEKKIDVFKTALSFSFNKKNKTFILFLFDIFLVVIFHSKFCV